MWGGNGRHGTRFSPQFGRGRIAVVWRKPDRRKLGIVGLSDREEAPMLRRRHEPATPPPAGPEIDRMHEWVLSLPWVVERPDDDTAPGVRYFAVDCEPLDRRQV